MMRTKGKTFVVWTPSLDEINGQNLVTQRVVERQNALISRVYAYPAGGGRAIPRAILLAIRLCVTMLLKQQEGIYLVCSRSPLGFLRDVLPLTMSLFGHHVIVHVHGSDFPGLFRRRIIGRLARLLYRECHVIVPSPHLVPLLQGIRFRHLQICENFASSPAVLPDAANIGRFRDERFTVLWNSNLMASKGIKELVNGLHLLHDDGIQIRLVILGAAVGDDEATEDDMYEFIETIECEDWIDIKGKVPPEHVAAYLEACDAVALPSTYISECQPLSVAQAMLAGRIVLVTPTDALHATVGTYPAIFAERCARAIADKFRPYAVGLIERDKRTATEVQIAKNRFSPADFDVRIGRIFSGQSEECGECSI